MTLLFCPKQTLDSVVNAIRMGKVQVWANELLSLCEEGAKCLEIGCGTGISSLWLAKNGRDVTAIDYNEESVKLIKAAANILDIKLNAICCDAREPLPFEMKEFDYIFQAGLLEHFDTNEQINLLGNWRKYSKKMISMIPNASSIAYRVGKEIMENNGTWSYGKEIPRHSMIEEYLRANISIEREYTIGSEWAFGFLPKEHYVKDFCERLINEGYNLDEYMQGYLLVTVGSCDKIC